MEQPRYNATSLHTKIRAVFLAMRRPDTPLYAKLAGGLFVYYALSPLDLIPDFIPLLGRADDMIILPFLAWLSFKLVPDEIMQECMREAENMPGGRLPFPPIACPGVLWTTLGNTRSLHIHSVGAHASLATPGAKLI